MIRELAQKLGKQAAKKISGDGWKMELTGNKEVGFYVRFDNGPFWVISSESPAGIMFIADCYLAGAVGDDVKLNGMDKEPDEALRQCVEKYGQWVSDRRSEFDANMKLVGK